MKQWKIIFIWCYIFSATNSTGHYYKSRGKPSIFHAHNYDSSSFKPIFVGPTANARIDSEHFSGQDQLSTTQHAGHTVTKLSNPLEYVKEENNQGQREQQSSDSRKLSNPWEFSNYNPPQASRPLPKYVVDAKKYFFGDYDDYEYTRDNEYTEEIMLTKATNHFKLPVTSNRATTTSRYIKVTSRPITFPQKTNSQTFPQKTNSQSFPQKTNSQTFPQKTHSHMKHVSFPSTTNSKKVVNQQPKRRTDSNSGAIIFNQPITTPQTTFRLPDVSYTRITQPILPTPLSLVQASGNGRKTKKEINEVKVKGKTNHKVQALQGSETFLLAKRPKRPTRPKRPQRPLNLTPLSVIMTSQTPTPTYKGTPKVTFTPPSTTPYTAPSTTLPTSMVKTLPTTKYSLIQEIPHFPKFRVKTTTPSTTTNLVKTESTNKISAFTTNTPKKIMSTKSTTLSTSTTPKPIMPTETIPTTRPLYNLYKKDELSLYEKQVMKLQSLLSGPQGDIRSVLLQETVLKLLPNLKKMNTMVRLEDALTAGKSGKLVQEDFFVFHTTLVQLQKILEAAEAEATSDIRPLLKRTQAHNMSLIKLLFHYIVQSGRAPGKKIILEDTKPFWKHYKPLKEVFPFL